MPRAEFFAKLGLFVCPTFVDAEWCARLCEEMRAAPHEPAAVSDGLAYHVDENSRRVRWLSISEEAQAQMRERLATLLPELAVHFALALRMNEPLQFLRYVSGDFFQLHTDGNRTGEAFESVKARRVSLVIFLNEAMTAGASADGYSGGALTLYGLLDQPVWQTKGFELQGETGLLVAFRSEVFHEVKPVCEGERFTIATWLAER